MKNLSDRNAYRLPLIAIAVLLCLWPTVTFSQVLQNSGIEGTEFVIAIPPNEINPYPASKLEIYIASRFDGEVTVYNTLTNSSFKRTLTAGNIRTLTDSRGETSWTSEIREFEKVLPQGIIISSTVPVSVYVLNGKVVSSDGYVAFPTNTWGKEYIVTTYYDFKEAKPWAGGFTVVGAEDNTEVEIDLRGVGETLAQTSGGRKINQNAPFKITLNRGEVYTVCGDGLTRGVFDLTGTKITADKPIGVINFHMRTTMPNMLINGNGRDHLCEWANPVRSWTKEIFTVPLDRKNQNGSGFGDVFRVVASEPNTGWNVRWYDITTGQLAGEKSGMLAKAGEFAEFEQLQSPIKIIDGPAVWTADKPVQIVQYSTSASFDGAADFDPFQILPCGQEQFVRSVIFQTPTDSKFVKHYLTLIVKVPADIAKDSVTKNLNSVTLDGSSVFQMPANKVTTGRFPNEEYYWARVEFGTVAVAHVLECNHATTFGGYIYGFGAVDSYGWGLGGSLIESASEDTVKPTISVKMDVKNNIANITTFDTGKGVSVVQMFVMDSSGTTLLFTSPGERFSFTEALKSRLSTVSFPNFTSTVQLLFKAADWAGNETTESFTLPGARAIIEYDSTSLDFGYVEAGFSKMKTITLRNVGNANSKSAASLNGPNFQIVSSPQFTIFAGDSVNLQVNFIAPSTTFGMLYDTLNVITGFGNLYLPLKGNSVQLASSVDEDYDMPIPQNATSVTVATLTGSIIQQWEVGQSNVQFSATGLPSGVYLMVVRTNSETIFRKLIVL